MITSAGLVLAGTFAVLGVLPLVFLTEIGFLVAFGILLDTILVRSVLVPALVMEVGDTVWWPSRLAKEAGRAEEERPRRAGARAGDRGTSAPPSTRSGRGRRARGEDRASSSRMTGSSMVAGTG